MKLFNLQIFRGAQLLIEGGSVFQPKAIVRYGNQNVKIMKFFWDAFELVSYDLRPYITDSSKKYIITGHSLGGALASIMALNGTQLFQVSEKFIPNSFLAFEFSILPSHRSVKHPCLTDPMSFLPSGWTDKLNANLFFLMGWVEGSNLVCDTGILQRSRICIHSPRYEIFLWLFFMILIIRALRSSSSERYLDYHRFFWGSIDAKITKKMNFFSGINVGTSSIKLDHFWPATNRWTNVRRLTRFFDLDVSQITFCLHGRYRCSKSRAWIWMASSLEVTY